MLYIMTDIGSGRPVAHMQVSPFCCWGGRTSMVRMTPQTHVRSLLTRWSSITIRRIIDDAGFHIHKSQAHRAILMISIIVAPAPLKHSRTQISKQFSKVQVVHCGSTAHSMASIKSIVNSFQAQLQTALQAVLEKTGQAMLIDGLPIGKVDHGDLGRRAGSRSHHARSREGVQGYRRYQSVIQNKVPDRGERGILVLRVVRVVVTVSANGPVQLLQKHSLKWKVNRKHRKKQMDTVGRRACASYVRICLRLGTFGTEWYYKLNTRTLMAMKVECSTC